MGRHLGPPRIAAENPRRTNGLSAPIATGVSTIRPPVGAKPSSSLSWLLDMGLAFRDVRAAMDRGDVSSFELSTLV
jgi:hypothetical protein